MSLEKVNLAAGFIEYQFNGRKYGPSTREFFVSAELPFSLKPKATLYYDFDAVKGFCATVGVDYNRPVRETVNLDFSFSVGYADSSYNSGYYYLDKNALNDGTIGVSATIVMNESWSVAPYLQYSWFWDSEVADNAKDNYGDSEVLAVGAKLTYAF